LQTEGADYGLYSYILFGSRPESPASEQWLRYLEAISAYLDVPTAAEVSRLVPASRMNISFLPVTCYDRELPGLTRMFHFDRERLAMHEMEHRASGNVSNHESSPRESACILVGSYDYARAQVLLSVLSGPHLGGPYIVSSKLPLSKIQTLPPQYLYQDLSAVPPKLIRLWVKEFMAQAQEEEFWKTRTKEQFILRLRTAIGVASDQLPDFGSAVKWTFAEIVAR